MKNGNPDKTITNPDYKEHEEIDYTHGGQYRTNLRLFEKKGHPLWSPTKVMYEYLRDYCIDFVKNHPQYPKFNWKPKICDVGCGGGMGSNILSQEADFVWGIDKDEDSIKFAKAFFERHKNNIYYTPQLTFDVIDIKNEPREIMAFDIVVCIETIEHISDYQKVLDFIKRLCKKDKQGVYLEPPSATKVFISTPNRNFKRMGKEYPKNTKHVREWTPEEFYGILTKNFKYVTLMNHLGELQELSMTHPIIFCKCETPL